MPCGKIFFFNLRKGTEHKEFAAVGSSGNFPRPPRERAVRPSIYYMPLYRFLTRERSFSKDGAGNVQPLLPVSLLLCKWWWWGQWHHLQHSDTAGVFLEGLRVWKSPKPYLQRSGVNIGTQVLLQQRNPPLKHPHPITRCTHPARLRIIKANIYIKKTFVVVFCYLEKARYHSA